MLLTIFICSSVQTEQFHRLYNFLMGNSNRSPEDYDLVSKFNKQNWVHQPNDSSVQIWRNKLTNEAAEVIRLYEIPSMEDMDVYSFRMMENDLVKVYHLSIDKNYDLCAVNQPSILLMQHIPIKLSNIRNFDREEALTILSAALRGFHLLEIKFGAIVPSEQLIGFNEQGKTKIWLNSKSHINSVDPTVIKVEDLGLVQQVSQRVKKLLRIVEEKTKYAMLPPSIREEICHPYTTYLSALKILQKFAYYQKLNLRKHLQFNFNKNKHNALIHRKLNSNFSQLPQNAQICCERNESSHHESMVKQPVQLKRMYSLNSISKSNKSSVITPIQMPIVNVDRVYQPVLIKHSVMSNNSSNMESVRPSSANFKHCHVINISTSSQKKNSVDLIDPPNIQQNLPETYQKETNIPKIKQNEGQTIEMQMASIQTYQNPIQSKTTQYQHYQIQKSMPGENQQDMPNNIIPSQRQNMIEQEIIQRYNNSVKQPISPTFALCKETQHQFRSFAPSQQNLQSKQRKENVHIERNVSFHNQQVEYPNQSISPQIFIKQVPRQERRLSIQHNKKIDFPPNELAINSVSILNYCTSIESKLHMATNRDHSIIQNKKSVIFSQLNKYQDEQIQNYIRQKYSIPQSKTQPKGFVVKVQKPYQKNIVKNIQINKEFSYKPRKESHNRVSTSLNRLDDEQDFLDVNYLQKSLDKRYCNAQTQLKIQQQKKELQENDALNIAKLEQGLLKFSKSQLSNKNTQHQIHSKQLISKKQFQYSGSVQHERPYAKISNFNPLEHSTGFQSYHPFKEKHFNEEKYQKINHQAVDYTIKNDKKAINQQSHYQKEYKQYENNLETNKNDYSFEKHSKNSHSPLNANKPVSRSYFIKETQLPSHEQLKNKHEDLYSQTNSFEVKQQKTTHRGISYQELRQFLWN